MSSFCKCKGYSHFFSKNISVYAIFDDQRFNDTLTNDIVSFEQLGPGCQLIGEVLLEANMSRGGFRGGSGGSTESPLTHNFIFMGNFG